MSIEINPENIIAVYALGEWHAVKRGSFCVDAYEIVEGGLVEGDEPPLYIHALGDYYPDIPGYNGATWLDPINQWRVSMSLAEIKAYQEVAK